MDPQQTVEGKEILDRVGEAGEAGNTLHSHSLQLEIRARLGQKM